MENFEIKDLQNKVVVITGAGGVICGGLAHAIAKNGAKVALLDLNLAAAQRLPTKSLPRAASQKLTLATFWTKQASKKLARA